MTSTKIFARALAVAATLAVAPISSLNAAEPSSRVTMKPLHGVSFDLGSERAVGYFLAENDACKLVLTIADEPDWDAEPGFTSTRFEALVAARKTTRFNSAEGKALEFACEAGAVAMNVTHLEKIAASPLR